MEFQAGDIITEKEVKYIEGLEKLWDIASEAVEGDHIRPKGQRYDWLVKQMRKLVRLEDRVEVERSED